jgi:chromosome segregation ATPase
MEESNKRYSESTLCSLTEKKMKTSLSVYQQLERAEERLEVLEAEKKSLLETNRQFAKENSALRSRLMRDPAGDGERPRDAVTGLDDAKRDLRLSLTLKEVENTELGIQNGSLSKEIEELREENARLRQKREKLSEQVLQLQCENRLLDKTNERLEEENAALNERNEELQEENDNLRDAVIRLQGGGET